MKPFAIALGVLGLALGLAMAAGGYGFLGSALNVLREPPGQSMAVWMDLPPVVVASRGLPLVEFGLIGVILILLAVLAGVLARGPYAPQFRERQEREARMVQDLFRGFTQMEERLESLESAVLRRAGRLSLGSKPN
jgi:hypothetical protein